MEKSGEEYKAFPQRGMAAYRATSLMQPHKARQALRDAYDGKIPTLIMYCLGVPTIPTARIIAQIGADFVWVDWEHSALGVETMTTIVHDIQHVSEGRSVAIVRVPGHEHSCIGFALDAGASVVIPQVETVEQAREVVAATKFGDYNKGSRSVAPMRNFSGVGDICVEPTQTLWENFNRQAAVIIQIENRKGVENLDAILTECGHHIDCVWIGTMDMRASMGLEGFWGDEPEFMAAVNKYTATLEKHKMPNSGMALMKNWSLTEGKVLTMVGGDGMALFGETELIADAKASAIPSANRTQFTAQTKLVNGHNHSQQPEVSTAI